MQIGKELLYLSRADVENVRLPMGEVIDILERAHTFKGEGKVNMPVKPVLGTAETGFSAAYVAEIAQMRAQGVKWLGANPDNPARGFAPVTGLFILNDMESRMPVAVMDCTYLTGMRTAGVSGIALRRLANPSAETVGVLGCGLQGRMNLLAAVTELKRLKRVLAWSPRMETTQKFVKEMRENHPFLEIEAAATAERAVREADALISSTPFGPYGSFRVIEPDWLKKGVTAVPVSQDAHFYPEALSSFDKYYIDDRTMFSRMPACARIVRPVWELSEYLTKKAPGREAPDEKILLLTEGIAINDVSVGKRVYERALELDIGTVLPL